MVTHLQPNVPKDWLLFLIIIHLWSQFVLAFNFDLLSGTHSAISHSSQCSTTGAGLPLMEAFKIP